MKTYLYKLLLFSICIILSPHFTFGQEAMSTDRPTASSGTYVMPKGVMQLETGYNNSNTDIMDGTISAKGYSGLIRFGIFKNIELRLTLDQTKIINDVDDTEVSGLSPIIVGFKANLKEEGKYCPAISFLGQLKLADTGKDEFQIDNSAPGFGFLFSKNLNNIFSLGANLGMDWNGMDASPASLSSIVLGISVTDWLGSYIELESIYNKNQDDTHIFNFGFTIWLESNTQLDFNYGFGLSEIALENKMTIGISARLFK